MENQENEETKFYINQPFYDFIEAENFGFDIVNFRNGQDHNDGLSYGRRSSILK